MGCTYTHDVSGARFADLDMDMWQCPHDTDPESDWCVFHADPTATDPEVPAQRLRELANCRERPVRLLGARLESLSLEYSVLNGPSNHPIDARAISVDGDLSCKGGTIKRPLWLDGASIYGSLSLENATCHHEFRLKGVTLNGPATFRLADFLAWVDVSETEFRDHVRGRNAEFGHGIVAEDALFRGAADFLNAHFEEVANFYMVTFEQGAVFNSTVFQGSARFDGATFAAPATKLQSKSGSGVVNQTPGTLKEISLSMRGAECRKNLQLEGVQIEGNVLLTDAELAHGIDTTRITSTGELQFNCRGTRTVGGTLDSADGEITYILTDATVGDVAFTDDSTIENLRFEGTRFDGFDFGLHKAVLADRGWKLHNQDEDPSYADLENLYLRAKNGAKDVGETHAAGEFFIHEMRYRRLGHRERLNQADSIREGVHSAMQWLGNAALAITCGYGERPFRPMVFSVGVILVFASLYTFPAPEIAYSRPAGYFLFSAEAFVSLIVGLPEAADTFVSLLLITEAFIGGFAVALFVYTLTRSVSR